MEPPSDPKKIVSIPFNCDFRRRRRRGQMRLGPGIVITLGRPDPQRITHLCVITIACNSRDMCKVFQPHRNVSTMHCDLIPPPNRCSAQHETSNGVGAILHQLRMRPPSQRTGAPQHRSRHKERQNDHEERERERERCVELIQCGSISSHNLLPSAPENAKMGAGACIFQARISAAGQAR